MLKQILNLDGAQELGRKELKSIGGGTKTKKQGNCIELTIGPAGNYTSWTWTCNGSGHPFGGSGGSGGFDPMTPDEWRALHSGLSPIEP